MAAHTDVAHFIAPAIKPIPVDGLIVGYAKANARGETTAQQRAKIEAYAMRVFGRQLDGFYEDEIHWDLWMDRSGMTALMWRVLNEPVGVIVVVDLKYISARGGDRLERFNQYCEQKGIKVHTCLEGAREHDVAIRPPRKAAVT